MYIIDAYLGEYFNEIAPGTTFKEIGRTEVKKEYIVFPHFKEQEVISDYLDRKCDQIRTLKIKLQEQINLLEAYQKSLVHECVTGKRAVTTDLKGGASV